MGVFSDIQAALDTTLTAISGIPPIVYDNVSYVPVQGTAFVRATVLPAASTLFTLNEVRKNPGIYQVGIFTPVGKGLGAALVIADAIKAYFETHRRIVQGSNTIFVMQVSIGKGEREDAWEHIFVEINYECYAL